MLEEKNDDEEAAKTQDVDEEEAAEKQDVDEEGEGADKQDVDKEEEADRQDGDEVEPNAKDHDEELRHGELADDKDDDEEVGEQVGDGESQHTEAATDLPSTDGVQTPQSTPSKKRKRGKTKMRKVAKDIQDRIEVLFTEIGEHAGSGSVTLSSFLGPLVREHVPVTLDDWRKLDEQTKAIMWEEIQVYAH